MCNWFSLYCSCMCVCQQNLACGCHISVLINPHPQSACRYRTTSPIHSLPLLLFCQETVCWLAWLAGWRASHEEWGDLHMTVSKLSNVYNPLPSCHWHNHATYHCNCLQGSLYLPLHRYIVPYTSFKFQLVATGMQGFASICSLSDRHARVELT